jgi:NRPS condensation-like uncharacterized protein
MRRWAALGPYNAGHVMRVTGAADLEGWRAAIMAVLREAGFENRENFSIALSPHDLEATIAKELNTPFAVGDCPLRAFVISNEDDSHFLGVIFDHWFADSYSMRLLMERFFVSYQWRDSDHAASQIRFATGEADDVFGKSKNVFGGVAALLACVRSYVRHRRAHRVKLSNPLDFRADFFLIEFPEGVIDRVRAVARNSDATVNDVFLAAIAQVLGARTADVRSRSRRNRLGLATAVDLRPMAKRALDGAFGFFLSYFTVVLERPEEIPLAELAAEIARETSAIKAKAEPIRFILGLRIMRMIWDILRGARRKAQLFPKALPLIGGISNVNLTGSWMDQKDLAGSGPRVIDYVRISPVGPLLPLVFTLSTIGDRLSLGVTYRTTAFSRDEAEQIAKDFTAILTKI